MTPGERRDMAERMAARMLGWPEAECHTLELLAERIGRGLAEYGPVHRGKRDWNRETGEELADAWIYMAFRRVVG
jgi:hypothetical protein